jgi:predicted SAM-dependent methyltransferase
MPRLSLKNYIQLKLMRVPVLFPLLKGLRDRWRAATKPAWLKRQVDERVARGEPIKIIIGAGGVPADPGWIATNVQFLNLLKDEEWRGAFGDNRIDAIFAEHVWEHLWPADGKAGAAQCFRYLRPGGYLRIVIPDGNHPDSDVIEFQRPGGYGCGADDHKIIYTIDTLSAMLESVGFKVEPLEYYDSEGKFHQAPWKPEDGRVLRCKGWTEKRPDGSTMQVTSLLVDARKP